MKKVVFLILFFAGCLPVMAQDQAVAPKPAGKEERFGGEALKVAYITKQLNLSVEEAQKFWPVHNNYMAEIKNARKEQADNEIAFEEKLLNIRKRYNNDFKKILNSEERANLVFKSEKQFGHLIGREVMERRKRMMDQERNNMDIQRKMLLRKKRLMEQQADPNHQPNRNLPDNSNAPEIAIS